MKKVLKVGCLSGWGFWALFYYWLFSVFCPILRRSPPSEKITSPVETEKGTTLPTAEPSPPKPKMLVWDKTPQGVESW